MIKWDLFIIHEFIIQIHTPIHQSRYHINKRKDENYKIISIDTEKALEKVQHIFLIKSSQQSRFTGNILQHSKSHI